MATTSSNLTAGTAISGQHNNGQGGKARAAGLVATAALGLALLGGLAFGSGPAAAATCVYASAAGIPGEGCDAPASAAVPTFVPDRFTYREDHRGELAIAFVPDAFTYREDHRASAQASVTGFLPGRYSRWIYA